MLCPFLPSQARVTSYWCTVAVCMHWTLTHARSATFRSRSKHRRAHVAIFAPVRSPIDRRSCYELAHVGDAIGDPSRAAMLVALMGGVAMPASELARVAHVVPSTATSHLRRLMQAGLVVVRAQGRHRYFALSGAHVAEAVERLVTLDARS